MASGLGDAVGGGVTVGAACIGDGDMTTRRRWRRLRGFEDLTTEQKPPTLLAPERGERHCARQQAMRGATVLLIPDLQVSVLRGTLLWPGVQVSSCHAARAGGTFTRSPYKDAWSQLDPQEYGFQKFGALWKHLVHE